MGNMEGENIGVGELGNYQRELGKNFQLKVNLFKCFHHNIHSFFSCPADSSIGDLVTHSLSEGLLILEHKRSHCTMWLSFCKSGSRENLFLCSHFIEI